MAVLGRWYWQINDLIVSTHAHLVQEANPGGIIPGRRHSPMHVAGLDGALADPDAPFAEKVVRLPITLLPWNADGQTAHPVGWYGRLVTNRADLLAELNGSVDLRWRSPGPVGGSGDSGSEAGEYMTLQADAVVYDEPVQSTDSRTMWDILVDFTIPRAVWRELPVVERAASTSHSFETGGSAPVVDPTLVFAGDGTWSDGTSTIEIDGSSSAVTVRRASTGEWEVVQAGVLAMNLLGAGSNGRFPRWAARSTVTTSGTASVAISYYRSWH